VFAHPRTGDVQSKARISLFLHAALKAAGLPERRFHDLRHTYGTAMAGAGVPLRTLQAWLGHADIQTAHVYGDYAPSAHEAESVARAFSSDRSESTEHGPA
jgi:integrase